jgi:A/G-specific adenine glycosylase
MPRETQSSHVPAPDRRRFARQIIDWQRKYGRHDLPWQVSRDPYAIWLSEVMLQQTQVTAVIPYYQRFLAAFPNCAALAATPLEDVMRHWSGLGYYSRARNLHRTAKIICECYGGEFPRAPSEIAALPGIGRSTAAAIAAFAFGATAAILDGNVKRVLSRAFGVEGDPASAVRERTLWQLAEQLLPSADVATYTQGLMDLGATVCVRRAAKCDLCPLAGQCVAKQSGRVDEFPSPRIRKPQPVRETAMLLIFQKGQVLVEKRPPTGIWGALWSLPEVEVGADAESICRERFGLAISAVTELPVLMHGFTHFSLRIHPLRIDARPASSTLREPGLMWIAPEDVEKAALPTPVKRLLRTP